jgi:hypothetical protein
MDVKDASTYPPSCCYIRNLAELDVFDDSSSNRFRSWYGGFIRFMGVYAGLLYQRDLQTRTQRILNPLSFVNKFFLLYISMPVGNSNWTKWVVGLGIAAVVVGIVIALLLKKPAEPVLVVSDGAQPSDTAIAITASGEALAVAPAASSAVAASTAAPEAVLAVNNPAVAPEVALQMAQAAVVEPPPPITYSLQNGRWKPGSISRSFSTPKEAEAYCTQEPSCEGYIVKNGVYVATQKQVAGVPGSPGLGYFFKKLLKPLSSQKWSLKPGNWWDGNAPKQYMCPNAKNVNLKGNGGDYANYCIIADVDSARSWCEGDPKCKAVLPVYNYFYQVTDNPIERTSENPYGNSILWMKD